MIQFQSALSAYGGEFAVLLIIILVGLPIAGAVYSLVSWRLTSYLSSPARLSRQVKDKHVLVSGASKGLGRALATKLVEAGAHVTLMARGKEALDQALAELQVLADEKAATARQSTKTDVKERKQILTRLAVDATDYKALVQALIPVIERVGMPVWVISNTGASTPGFIADQPYSAKENEGDGVAERMMGANYFSAVHLVRALVELGKRLNSKRNVPDSDQPISGLSKTMPFPERFIFVGSVLSIMSFLGYSAYSASKYALRGLCDSLRSEFAPLGTKVHLYLPANMDTPGFQAEGLTKPEITALIEGTASMASADECANVLLANVLAGRYYITNDVLGEMIRISVHGASPRPNVLAETVAVPLFALAFSVWSLITDWEVRGYFAKARPGAAVKMGGASRKSA